MQAEAQPWQGERVLTAATIALLIQAQFPQLAPVCLRQFSSGWDNQAWLVNDAWVFRFPHRQFAADLVAREAQFLPLLAPRLPLRISVPDFVGQPSADYPWVWAGYPLLAGETADRAGCSAAERAALAPVIGGFLRALHGLPIDAAMRRRAPHDEIARADFALRVPSIKQRIQAHTFGLLPSRPNKRCDSGERGKPH